MKCLLILNLQRAHFEPPNGRRFGMILSHPLWARMNWSCRMLTPLVSESIFKVKLELTKSPNFKIFKLPWFHVKMYDYSFNRFQKDHCSHLQSLAFQNYTLDLPPTQDASHKWMFSSWFPTKDGMSTWWWRDWHPVWWVFRERSFALRASCRWCS